MAQLTNRQQYQEEQYIFPYHYLSLHFELYRRVVHLRYLSLLRVIKEMLKPFEGQRLLDAGCGDGRFCYELRDENVDVVGWDYSQKAIAFAKVFNPSVEFHVVDLINLRHEEEFDIITLIEVLEHFPPETVSVVIANLWRALRPGGRLLVSAPTTNMSLSEKHYQHFTVETLEKLFVPMFEPVTKRGHTKGGKTWIRYNQLQKSAKLVWPLRNKVPGINKFLRYVENYYYKKVETCEINQADGIIEIFEKEGSYKKK